MSTTMTTMWQWDRVVRKVIWEERCGLPLGFAGLYCRWTCHCRQKKMLLAHRRRRRCGSGTGWLERSSGRRGVGCRWGLQSCTTEQNVTVNMPLLTRHHRPTTMWQWDRMVRGMEQGGQGHAIDVSSCLCPSCCQSCHLRRFAVGLATIVGSDTKVTKRALDDLPG